MSKLTREQFDELLAEIVMSRTDQLVKHRNAVLLKQHHDALWAICETQGAEDADCRTELAQAQADLARVTKELEEATCGEALCGHDHSTQYWELRCNNAEQQLARVTKDRDEWQNAAQQQFAACLVVLEKIHKWLVGQALRCRSKAKTERFITLKEALIFDAVNYEAVCKDIEAVLKSANDAQDAGEKK